MGACNISMKIKGDKTSAEVRKAFNERQESDREEYGTDSYNGTFSTVHGLKITSLLFDTPQEAYDYLDTKIEKYEPAVAVRFKDKDGSINWEIAAIASC